MQLTRAEVVALCFDAYGQPGIWTCRCCGALVPADRRELHLGWHHPDPVDIPAPGQRARKVYEAGWKIGIPPMWARNPDATEED